MGEDDRGDAARGATGFEQVLELVGGAATRYLQVDGRLEAAVHLLQSAGVPHALAH